MAALASKRSIFTTALRLAATAAKGESHSGGMDLWKKLTFFGALPSVGIMMVYVFLEHQKAHEHHVKKEYIPYDYLRKRDKRFPFGDGTRTLFHNPHVNYHPDE